MKSIFVLAITLVSWIAQARNLVTVDGSSTVFPITEAVSEEFQKMTKGETQVTVGVSGTGGGFKKFCRGETDVQDASRPITKEEMAACRTAKITYFELPIAFDAIAIVVNTKNTWVNEITCTSCPNSVAKYSNQLAALAWLASATKQSFISDFTPARAL